MKYLIPLFGLLALALPASAMTEPIFIDGVTPLSAASATYYQFQGMQNVQAGTTVPRQPVAIDGTVANLHAHVVTAPGSGKSLTITLFKAAVATSLTCTISDTNTSCVDSTHSVSVVAGDDLEWEVLPTGTPTTSVTSISGTLVGTSAGEVSISAGSSGLGTAATAYAAINGGAGSAIEASSTVVFPTDGTIDHLYGLLSGTPGVGKSYDLTVYKNGVATALTLNIAGAATTNSDLTHSFAVSAGDTLSMQSTPTGTPSNVTQKWAFRFRPTTDGETPLLSLTTNSSQFVTVFETPVGTTAFSTTETNKQLIVPVAFTLKKLYVKMDVAPGGVATRTEIDRKNTANGTLTTTISGVNTTGNDTTHSDSYAENDLINWSATLTGSPAAFNRKSVAAVAFITPAGGGGASTPPSIIGLVRALWLN